MLIASDESHRSEDQKQQTLSQHLFLLLHFQNQQLQRSRRVCFLLPCGLLVQLPTNSDQRRRIQQADSSPFDNSFGAIAE